MIHYHGTPMTPESVAARVLAGRHGLVSWAHPQQIDLVAEVCQSFVLDNGAFSAWRSGHAVCWPEYRNFVQEWRRHPGFDWALIPDSIDGGEAENDSLVRDWPLALREWSVPVWHLHESLDRLRSLSHGWPRVALGSSGTYSTVGTQNWWVRMHRVMETVCDEGRPRAKLHGLRMLNPSIFKRLPLSSADSCNVARNIGIDAKWDGTYEPPDKAWRGLVIAARIEAQQSTSRWEGAQQLELALRSGQDTDTPCYPAAFSG